MTQATLLTAVHAQPAVVVTVIVFDPPAAIAVRVVGVIEYEHGAASCVTVNVCPPIVTVAVRLLDVVFPPTLMPTTPFPEPLAPLVTVSHAALLTAVHAQPAGAVTPTLVDPTVAGTDALVAESVMVQEAPACVTVTA